MEWDRRLLTFSKCCLIQRMGGNSSLPEKPLYLSTCKCGMVQIELYDEPIKSVVCYCDDCQAAAAYVELKRRADGLPNTCPCLEENPENRGICCSMFYLEKMRFVKGMDKMKAFRNSPSATCIRPYTSCCNTMMIVLGGSKVPVNFRVINSNTLTVAATGEKYKPDFAYKMQGKSGNIDFWVTVTEEDGIPKHDGIPTGNQQPRTSSHYSLSGVWHRC
eukprot:1626909-Rhodomonas_salina.1